MNGLVLASWLFASTSLAVNITFASKGQCAGLGLYGTTSVDQSIPCYNLSAYYDPAQSLIVADVAGYTVSVYSDDACGDAIAEATDDTCIDFAGKTAQSFIINKLEDTARNITLIANSNTTDLVPYGIKLSDYTGLSQTSPYQIDLDFSEGWINTYLLHVASGLTLSFAVTGCVLIGVTTPLTLATCVGTGIGTILTYIGHARIHLHNKRKHGTYALSTGHLDRRELIDQANYDYLHAIHGNDPDTFQDGWMERDMGQGVQRSPVYRFNRTEDGFGQFIFSAFYNEDTGNMLHVMETANDSLSSALQRRYTAYDGIRKSGFGIAYEFCPFHTSASSSSWDESIDEVYKRVRDQLGCLHSATDYGDATALLVDFQNSAGVVVGSANIAPYKYGGAPDYGGLTLCTEQMAPTDEDCIVN